MWVVERIKKGSSEIFRKKWRLSNDDKFVMWAIACFAVVVLMLIIWVFER